jgi:uncharacterized protein
MVSNMTDAIEILRKASSVLLVDWPNTGVPRALLDAGLMVFGSSPAGYSRAQLTPAQPDESRSDVVFAPEADQTGYLVFQRLSAAPPSVDVVCVYRPATELRGIVERLLTPLRAGTLWLQPPIRSDEARALADDLGILFVEGIDIAEAARSVAAGW